MQSQTKLEQMTDVIATMSKGELFLAYNILKAYYEVLLEECSPLAAATFASENEEQFVFQIWIPHYM